MIDWPYEPPQVDEYAGKTIALALTGASGMPYALRLLQCLLAAKVRVWLLYSQVAQIVAAQEMQLALPSRPTDMKAARCIGLALRLRMLGSSGQ